MATRLLKKLVDAEQWDAKDVAGRLGMVLHAAFLFAGFQAYGVQPRWGHLLKKKQRGGSLCLSRLYTAPDLARREGADAAVLMLWVQGNDVALLVFLTTADGDGVPAEGNAYLERLDLNTVRPLLSRSLGGVEPWASRICRSLADGVCWRFLDELRRRNGLPLSGFESLPDDLKAAVLEKLTDGKDLARVECVSSQLRLLVAERDHELWKALYKALPARQRRCCSWPWFLLNAESSEEVQETLSLGSSWKHKYVEARWCWRPRLLSPLSWYFDSFDSIRIVRRRRDLLSWPPLGFWSIQDPPEEEEEEETVPPRVKRSGGGQRQKLARNDCRMKRLQDEVARWRRDPLAVVSVSMEASLADLI